MFVNFGAKKVLQSAKQGMVNNVFSSVSKKYDIMNEIMSFGLHRKWKKDFVDLMSIKNDDKILDLASGTGDIVRLIEKKAKNKFLDISIIASDINLDMLSIAEEKLSCKYSNIYFKEINGENINENDEYFDSVTLSFGLRNYANIDKGLEEVKRVLKKDGTFYLMEFSRPRDGLMTKCYEFYSNNIIPKFGKFVAKDEESYKYFVDSINEFLAPDQVKEKLKQVGFNKIFHKDYQSGLINIYIARNVL